MRLLEMMTRHNRANLSSCPQKQHNKRNPRIDLRDQLPGFSTLVLPLYYPNFVQTLSVLFSPCRLNLRVRTRYPQPRLLLTTTKYCRSWYLSNPDQTVLMKQPRRYLPFQVYQLNETKTGGLNLYLHSHQGPQRGGTPKIRRSSIRHPPASSQAS